MMAEAGDASGRTAERPSAVVDFSRVYTAHARDVHRFVLFLSGDASLADDIVSETFIRVWNARERVDLATVKAYLFAIARNLFLESRRRARHTELDDRLADPDPGPERRQGARGELALVMAALQELPEIDRAAVLMRADESMPYEQIAASLGISPAAARVKVHRARLKLANARLGARASDGRRETR